MTGAEHNVGGQISAPPPHLRDAEGQAEHDEDEDFRDRLLFVYGEAEGTRGQPEARCTVLYCTVLYCTVLYCTGGACTTRGNAE